MKNKSKAKSVPQSGGIKQSDKIPKYTYEEFATSLLFVRWRFELSSFLTILALHTDLGARQS